MDDEARNSSFRDEYTKSLSVALQEFSNRLREMRTEYISRVEKLEYNPAPMDEKLIRLMRQDFEALANVLYKAIHKGSQLVDANAKLKSLNPAIVELELRLGEIEATVNSLRKAFATFGY